jgi:hypothetical protein
MVTVTLPVFPSEVAVITARPGETALTIPAASTVATACGSLLHVRGRPVRGAPSPSRTTAESSAVCPRDDALRGRGDLHRRHGGRPGGVVAARGSKEERGRGERDPAGESTGHGTSRGSTGGAGGASIPATPQDTSTRAPGPWPGRATEGGPLRSRSVNLRGRGVRRGSLIPSFPLPWYVFPHSRNPQRRPRFHEPSRTDRARPRPRLAP